MILENMGRNGSAKENSLSQLLADTEAAALKEVRAELDRLLAMEQSSTDDQVYEFRDWLDQQEKEVRG